MLRSIVIPIFASAKNDRPPRGVKTRLCALVFGVLTVPVLAQTVLPNVDVRAPKWEERHGGYLISSNFEVDPRMSAVVFPAEPFQKDDILSVRFTQIKEDEYFVLQECISTDCTQAHILRVWNAYGALGITAHKEDRVWIPHEGKFFMWMQRFPMSGGGGPVHRVRTSESAAGVQSDRYRGTVSRNRRKGGTGTRPGQGDLIRA